jgi:hypothetical protein
LRKNDNVGFHRETMFSDNPNQTSRAHNIWVPITPVTEKSAVRYFEGSQLIPDSELEIIEDKYANRVSRGSFGHKLGMLYYPKTIWNIPPLSSSRFMLPTLNEFSLFSAMTIHGSGVNNSNSIRLSLSMAIIDKDDIVYNKPYQAAGGNPHYVSI